MVLCGTRREGNFFEMAFYVRNLVICPGQQPEIFINKSAAFHDIYFCNMDFVVDCYLDTCLDICAGSLHGF